MASNRISIIAGLITAFFLGGAALSCLVIIAYLTGPSIEGRYFPIIKTVHVADSVQRSGRLICWDTLATKLRTAHPVYFEYFIERGISTPHPSGGSRIDFETIPLAPFDIDSEGQRRYLSKHEDHKPGQQWTAHYCVELPGDVHNQDGFVLRGDAMYAVGHGLWQVQQMLPSFQVPEGITDEGRKLDPSRPPMADYGN